MAPKTKKEVNKQNIISGPCRSLKVGNREVGGTSEGVEVEFTTEYEDMTVDELLDAVNLEKTNTQMTVSTSLAEATLENLKLAWAQNSEIEEDVQTGIETLHIGTSADVKEHTLEFVGPAPNGKERTYTAYRAISMSASQHAVKKGEKVVFPVQFRILPDPEKPEGQEYGSIVDRAVE